MTLLARLTERLTHLAERGALPDALTRAGIRTLLRDRLEALHGDDCELRSEYTGDFLNLMRMSPCAVVPEKANAQHYELPPAFFATVLGKHRKYSRAYRGPTHDLPDLNSAEAAALEMTCLRRQWRWNGRHYQRTANAWLERMDANRHVLAPLFDATYGAEASIWWPRWRLFFMACAELFGYDHDQQWWVSHYLFERQVQSLDARPTHRFPTVHDGGRPTASKAATPADREAA